MTSFDEYRDRMLAIIATAEKLLPVQRPRDTEILDLYRARMSRILTAYHLYADRELFTPCMGMADPAERKRVREISAECATLAQEFRAFTRQCSENPAIDRWPEYRVASHAMMARIRRHLLAAEAQVTRCAVIDGDGGFCVPQLKAG